MFQPQFYLIVFTGSRMVSNLANLKSPLLNLKMINETLNYSLVSPLIVVQMTWHLLYIRVSEIYYSVILKTGFWKN